MNYRHIYHAGNFADVFKHCILVLLIESLLQKDKPFCYVDTHAGLGVYDLYTDSAQKTQEYSLGISRLLDRVGGVKQIDNANASGVVNAIATDIPEELVPYFSAIKKLNASQLLTSSIVKPCLTGSDIRYYPGSPYLVRSLLRPQDRMILMELHKEDVLLLKKLFTKDKQVAVHHYDGYQGLKAFLPPAERRGLVLIDPSFEQKNEFELILAALKVALSCWHTGIYAIWYPIKDFALVNNFHRALNKMNVPILISQMTINKQTVLKEFVGCGMAIVNPPWQLDKKLEKILPWLWKVLSVNHDGALEINK